MTWKSPEAAAVVEQAWELREHGRTSEAVTLLRGFDQATPNAWVRATAGEILRLDGQLDEALPLFDGALALEPSAAYTRALRGDCQAGRARPRSAAADYERALHLGLPDAEWRAEVCALVADVFEFLYEDLGDPGLQWKARHYRRRAEGAGDDPLPDAIESWRVRFEEGLWVPGESFAGLELGAPLPPAVLQHLCLRPARDVAWTPFDAEAGLTLYADNGVLDCVKARRVVRLGDTPVLGQTRLALEELLGASVDEDDVDGAAWAAFPDVAASTLFREGRAVEMLVWTSLP